MPDCTAAPLPKECVTTYKRVDPATVTTRATPDGGVETVWSPEAPGKIVKLNRPTPLDTVLRTEGALQQAAAVTGRANPKARPTQYATYCQTGVAMRLLHSPNVGHYARGDHLQWCLGATGQTVAGYLWRYNSGWSLMDGPVFVPGPGNAVLQGFTVRNCFHTSRLLYQAQSIGSAYIGLWVVGPTIIDNEEHTCPS